MPIYVDDAGNVHSEWLSHEKIGFLESRGWLVYCDNGEVIASPSGGERGLSGMSVAYDLDTAFRMVYRESINKQHDEFLMRVFGGKREIGLV